MVGLNEHDELEFERRFPEAMSFIRHCQLIQELDQLECGELRGQLNTWGKNRLEELRAWKKNDDIVRNA